jgi:hypothetical protein
MRLRAAVLFFTWRLILYTAPHRLLLPLLSFPHPQTINPPPHAVAASHLLQVLQCAASLGILRQVGDNSVTLCMRGPAVDVGFSSEWALLLRSSSVANPSPIEYIKTPITPFGTA